MKITNILIQQTETMQQISWFYKNRECYFENPGKTDPIDIMEWILSMPEEDMREHYVEQWNWFECLGLVMSQGRKISLIS